MNKLIRLSSTGIEYGDYAWNFASGCGNNIDGKCKAGGFRCWAYPITQRFAERYPNGFNPTIYLEALLSPLYLKKPSRILCAFMGDLFWDCPEFDPWIEIVLRGENGRVFFEGSLRDRIMMTIDQCPQHTFLFLTKQPQNLIKFSPFPDNCWVGVSATDSDMLYTAYCHLAKIQAKVKYISFEPLLSYVKGNASILKDMFREAGISWVILGSQTKPYRPPTIEAVRKIVQAADKAGIPVFLKENLKSFLPIRVPFYKRDKSWVDPKLYYYRQEMPK